MCGSAHAGQWVGLQRIGNGLHQMGVNERFVPLHVHHDIVIMQTQDVAGFCQTVAT